VDHQSTRRYTLPHTETRTIHDTMAPLLRLLLTALLAAAAAAADCGSLDMRVDSAGPGTATVSLKPPEDATKIRFDYSTGKFPTVDEVELRSNMQRVNYVMKDLDPGTEYPLRVTPICGEYATCEAGPSDRAYLSLSLSCYFCLSFSRCPFLPL